MIEVSPFPDGRDFAITFVDDTDRSTRANTEPVYDFLAKESIRGAKTVWALRAKRNSAHRTANERQVPEPGSGSTLEDEDYRQFVEGLPRMGFEIALHGVAAGNSRREEIVEGLSRFQAVFGHPPDICAFHQTNIDNLYCGSCKLDSVLLRLIERLTDQSEYQGHVQGSPYFWGDLAQAHFKYVRLPFHTIDEVNTLRVSPAMPFYDPRRPFVRSWFASSDGADVSRFNRLLSERNLDRLERQRGACVIYTHFAKGFARPCGGRYHLDADFVAAVRRISAYPNVWLPTASELLDRLTAARRISVRQQGLAVTVCNEGSATLDGLTLRLPPGIELYAPQGGAVSHQARKAIIRRLAAGESVVLHSSHFGHGAVVASLHNEITLGEHRRVEFLNYLGLVRGLVRDRYAPRRRRFAGSEPRESRHS